jgi:hypothetical protein
VPLPNILTPNNTKQEGAKRKKIVLALEVMVASHFSRKEFNLVADLNLSGGNTTGVSL